MNPVLLTLTGRKRFFMGQEDSGGEIGYDTPENASAWEGTSFYDDSSTNGGFDVSNLWTPPDTSTNLVDINSETGNVINPENGLDVNADTGLDINPYTGNDINAETGYDINPSNGLDINPNTGLDIDPYTGNDIDPVSGEDVATSQPSQTPSQVKVANTPAAASKMKTSSGTSALTPAMISSIASGISSLFTPKKTTAAAPGTTAQTGTQTQTAPGTDQTNYLVPIAIAAGLLLML
jgi:hypothetical protein